MSSLQAAAKREIKCTREIERSITRKIARKLLQFISRPRPSPDNNHAMMLQLARDFVYRERSWAIAFKFYPGYLYTHVAQPSAQATCDIPPGVIRYAEYLKSIYKTRPCGDQWLPVVSERYIELSTVDSMRDFPKEKEDTRRLAMMHSKIEEVKRLKKTIQIGQVGDSMMHCVLHANSQSFCTKIRVHVCIETCVFYCLKTPGWPDRRWCEG